MTQTMTLLKRHQTQLRACHACPDMSGPAVAGEPVISRVLLIGQAPGDREIVLGKPFAWTAGKTLFGWFESIGLPEPLFRQRVYMAAVCRCFPGKNPKGGDRVPSATEIHYCRRWLNKELELLAPELVLPVGKLAISQFMPVHKLDTVVGRVHCGTVLEYPVTIIPLPHPSGASTWHRTEPGRTLLKNALELIRRHQAWKALL